MYFHNFFSAFSVVSFINTIHIQIYSYNAPEIGIHDFQTKKIKKTLGKAW